MAIASWQAFVQDVAKSLRDAVKAEMQASNSALLMAQTSTPSIAGSLRLTEGAIAQWENKFEGALNNYSTPGWSESRELLKWFGFDPIPLWKWTQAGGRGTKPFFVKSKDSCDVLGQWLEVRHAIAHGHADFTRRRTGLSGHKRMVVLSAVRDTAVRGTPGLRLTDAEACVRFISALARLTADAATSHLATTPAIWSPTPPQLRLGVNPSEL